MKRMKRISAICAAIAVTALVAPARADLIA